MQPFSLSMRWWLGLAFALVAATTAFAAAEGMAKRSEAAFRENAEKRALEQSLAAKSSLRQALERGNLDDAVLAISTRRRLALFVLDRSGQPITPARASQTELGSIPGGEVAIREALAGNRYVRSYDQGRVTVVALPMPLESAAALLTYSLQPGYASTMTMIRDQIATVVVWPILLGGVAGLAIATLTTRRLRRIAKAARAIEAGDFTRRVDSRFHDEIGMLADAFDRMRTRLQESFDGIQTERLRLRRTLERLDQGVVAIDAELKVEAANDAALRLLDGLSEGDALPDSWPDFPLRSFSSALFGPDTEVVRVRVSTGDDRHYTLDGIPAGQAFRTALLVITDVSELERRERIEREFVTNAAHELRTPVAAISGAVEVLQLGAKDQPAERDHFLAIIDRQSGRLARLSRSLLVLARAQTGAENVRLSLVELCPLLEEIADALSTNEEVSVEVDCPEGLLVFAERDLLDQVFSNLATNAAKHTERGRIAITARPLDAERVSIEFVDTGSGIATEAQARIFDRFYRGRTREPNGFGLGLSIVRQAVAALNGTIEVYSRTGSGTSATVTLPLARPE
ncbi:MAG: HAMP domain-containing protein [Actinobacteria bacterium]|nr:HAMP domain-containing protein [Actinomycetota bacterium]